MLEEGRALHRLLVLGGDWNANVGQTDAVEVHDTVGRYGYGVRTARGALLADFVSSEGLRLCNRMFDVPVAERWTCRNPLGEFSQLDYIITGSVVGFFPLLLPGDWV